MFEATSYCLKIFFSFFLSSSNHSIIKIWYLFLDELEMFNHLCVDFWHSFSLSIFYLIFASQGLRFGSPFSPSLADLEYILRIHALIFHWLRLPVHVSNQKTFYTEHMLSTKCKQRWHRNALIWQRFATSRFGSNENIFPVCQSFEIFTWLTVSASKLNLSQISFSSLGSAIFNSPTYA
jgi:hypothetical protein